MNAYAPMNTALMIDESKKIFRVSRQAFVDPAILDAERAQIFDKCWLYLGHSSELAKPAILSRARSEGVVFCSPATARAISRRC
jgi:p-cumate 2,3-dioxygenase alpha subunit